MWQFRVRRLDSAAYYQQDLGFSNEVVESDEVLAKMMVEEAMITVNAFTAQYLKANGVSAFYRTYFVSSLV